MVWNRLYLIASVMWLTATSVVLADTTEPEAASGIGKRPAATAAEISKWIAQLDDDRYLVRERATRQLMESGAEALDPLLAAADAGRPEPADRSVWILQRLSAAKEAGLRRDALEHLSKLKKRPQVAAAAKQALIEIARQEALQAIEQLGGQYVAENEFIPQIGPNFAPRVILDERWHGGNAGLVHLRNLAGLRQVKILGTDITLEGLKELQYCESLQDVWLYGTRLTPEDVAKLRKMLPEQVLIDYRRGGLLGVMRSPEEVGPAKVDNVQPGSAAAVAGIQHGDVIQKFNGEPVASFKALTQKIGDHHPGDEIKLEVLRNGKPMEFKVKLGKWKTVE